MTALSRCCARLSRLVSDAAAVAASSTHAVHKDTAAALRDERWVGAPRPGRNARLTAPTLGNDASPPTIRAPQRKNSDDRTAGGSFSSRDLRLGEHPSDPPHACVSLIPRQAAMANVKRLARKEKTAVLVWLKIYLICLLPFPAAESTAQRCKNAHLPYPR
jgi:hypothetical protein